MDNRAQVREFLASRRARITPGQAGLPAYGGNRRVKGLRREEVALLAGVSIDYYIRMERGDLAGASEAVLDGVANALQLDEAEREHLQALARSARPVATRRARPSPATVRPVIQQVLDAITEAPAWIRNARHDILAMNPLARALYSPVLDSAVAGATAKRAANTTRFIYLDPAAREFFIDYDRMATDAAAMLRLEAGRNPHDKALITLVGELSTQSELFRQHWAEVPRSFRTVHPLGWAIWKGEVIAPTEEELLTGIQGRSREDGDRDLASDRPRGEGARHQRRHTR